MTSGTTTMTAAPTIDPQTLPIPPSTTIDRMKIEVSSVKPSGLTKLTLLAWTTPATPAVDAPMAKAHSFILTVGTPMAAAASSSSRIATQARPMRDRLSRMITPIIRAHSTRRRK